MNHERSTPIIVGALFICATVSSLVSSAIEHPVLRGTNYLARITAHGSLVSIGALLELIAAGTSVGIAVALYPVLRDWSARLALGSVVFRTIEAVMYTSAAVSLLSLPAVSHQLATAAIADRASLQMLGDFVLAARQQFTLAGVFAFCLGALMYYAVFFRSGLIPRWLSGWGVAGVLLLFVACLFALFSGNPVTGYAILILPIAVQEMVLAVWLIVRGFAAIPRQAHRAAITAAPAIS